MRLAGLWAWMLLAAGAAAVRAADAPFSQADVEFFETSVRPVLVERCFDCHGGEGEPEGGLRLNSREAALAGGATGPAAVAGDPAGSLLVQAIGYRDALQMPPDGRLTDEEIAALTKWVELGMPWPAGEAAPTTEEPATGGAFKITDEHRAWWAFQPLAHVEPPKVTNASWAKGPVDQFILAKLEATGLTPAAAADRRTLIRRASYDLTGLPPTVEEVDAFVNDASPDAFAKVVERLLASPAYGERWGRHWLDLVRYTDSFDSRIADGSNPIDCSAAWKYRDWVVDALNQDMPYDQFVMNQVAGDLLPAKDSLDVNAPGLVATGMLAIGNWGGGDADKEKLITDIADDQIDVVTRGFLGITVACARCHDHKFDPISTADYYGLAGIFLSTHIFEDPGPKGGSPVMLRAPLETNEDRRLKTEYEAQLTATQTKLDAIENEQYQALASALAADVEKYLQAAWDYSHWTGETARPAIESFALERGLQPFAVRSWIDALEVNRGNLLATGVDNLLGKPGLFAWRGAADTPSLVANANAEPVSFLSIQLPPRSVAIHPSPAAAVGVEWRAPMAGRFKVTGYVQDADSSCGNGVDWTLGVRHDVIETQIAAGGFDNGGRQEFGDPASRGVPAPGAQSVDAQNPAATQEFALSAGDAITVAVLPRGEHSCDTTLVELTIAEIESGRSWNLAKDVLIDPLEGGRGNPHRDAAGTPAVWRFLDLAGARSAPAWVKDAALRSWYEVAVQSDRDATSQQEAAQAARAVQESVDRARQSPLPVEGDPSASTLALLVSPESPLWGEARGGEAALATPVRAELVKLRDELTSLRANPPADPGYANACTEGGCPTTPQVGVHDARIHVRGRYDRLGPIVPRRFPEVLAGEAAMQSPINEGSGRLQLAEWLAKPENPLPARVMANRIWQHHFGEGIVRTPSNFGKLGEAPTHPELLDYLASQFIASGWSIKAMHRQIMLSATYQQSSTPSAAALEKDGDNRLLGRMNSRRLDDEQLRDSLLAVSGQLDATRGGPPVREIDSPRKTLYLMTIRSVRATFRDLFDGADSTAIVDKRIESTVAPQALFMLNNPFVLKQSELLAVRVAAAAPDDGARIEQLYRWLFGRQPAGAELEIAGSLLAAWRDGGDEQAEAKAWEQYCQTLLCSNEFTFID